MVDQSSLDNSLKLLGARGVAQESADFMDGIWQRAGQLSEIAEQRRRAALFSGLFVIGLGAGIGTTGLPHDYDPSPKVAYSDFATGDQLAPSALLHLDR